VAVLVGLLVEVVRLDEVDVRIVDRVDRRGASRNELGLRNFCLNCQRYATSSRPSPVLSTFT